MQYFSCSWFSKLNNKRRMILFSIIFGFFITNECDLAAAFLFDEKLVHDFNLTTTEIIIKYGYPAQTHTVVSEDGYIMESHRIPHGQNSTKIGFPILLAHGLFLDSSSYVLYGRNSLAFYLVDEGYDVWLINTRGNHYGRAHETLRTDDEKFWDFSWHEMGIYDLPAHIDYILKYTNNSELLYLGYSVTSTTFFVIASERPEYQEKIRGALLLAPVATLRYIRTPIRSLTRFNRFIQFMSEILLKGGFFKNVPFVQMLDKNTCTLTSLQRHLCKQTFYLLFSGMEPLGTNKEALANFLAHNPSSTSSKSLSHYAQNVNSGKFSHYDYGYFANMAKYGSESPPEYNLSSITVPMSLFAGATDYLADPDDIRETLSGLPAVKSIYYVPCRHFQHLGFLLTNNIKERLYNEVLQHLKYFMDPEKGIRQKNYKGPIINPEQFPICT